jgi:hypothetical protein
VLEEKADGVGGVETLEHVDVRSGRHKAEAGRASKLGADEGAAVGDSRNVRSWGITGEPRSTEWSRSVS